MFKKYDNNDFLAKMFLLFNALFIGVTGFYLILADNVEVQSSTYRLMSGLLSLDAWGVVMLTSGALYTMAAFQEGRLKYKSMLIAGLVGGVMFALYTMASMEASINIMVPMRYAVIATFNLIIAGVGGIALWNDKGDM